VSFINSESLKFKYKLEGLDHDWVEAGMRRTAYFSHVPPGNYTFKVIAANSDGVWNADGKSLRISVLPPFYRTWWFLTLAALSLGAALAAIYKYRVSQLERVQAAQQAFSRQLIASQENDRKRIAAELHDGLGQSLVIIRNWALLGAGQLSPDSPAKEELEEITSTASRAINEVREIAYNLGPYHLERLGLANTIQDMVKRVAKISGVNITAELDPLDGSLTRETEMSLYRITQEAINNMVKHSQATEARVSLKREAAGIRLTINDNGRGFNTHTVASTDGSGTSQTGFGLTGIAERVRLIDGALTIRSAPGQGTTIEAVVGNKSA
jgi:signal transduction histidine kinase